MSRWKGWLVLLGALVWAGLALAEGAPVAAAAKAVAENETMAVAPNIAAEPLLATRGEAVFRKVCAPCHGAGPGIDGSPLLPGTAKLQAKYQGAVPAALENRRDLNAAALRAFVRNGVGAMPRFRPTEVSDADLEALAVWLARRADAR